MDGASSSSDASTKGDGNIFVARIKTVLYQLVGYCLPLRGRPALYQELKSFTLFEELPQELRDMIYVHRSGLPYPLLLLCKNDPRSTNKGYYEVKSTNFADFLKLSKTDVARITDLKVTWVTTRVHLPQDYDSVRDRVADFRTQGATMESANNLKSITLDLSRDCNGCAYYLRTMTGLILATNSKISSVTVVLRLACSKPSWASSSRLESAQEAITQQLGFAGVSFKNHDQSLYAICWEGDATAMKQSVRANADYLP